MTSTPLILEDACEDLNTASRELSPAVSGAARGDLAGLLARVEAATGPDRWLDAAITAALTGGDAPDTGGGYRPASPERPASFVMAPLITASLDDALALCERVLPLWELELTSEHRDDAMIWRVMLGDPLRGMDGEAPTPALALLAAILKALCLQAHDTPAAGQVPGRNLK